MEPKNMADKRTHRVFNYDKYEWRAPLKKLWPHKPDDETTWKYSDVIISGERKGKRFIKEWVLNKDFKYKHLDPKWPKWMK